MSILEYQFEFIFYIIHRAMNLSVFTIYLDRIPGHKKANNLLLSCKHLYKYWETANQAWHTAKCRYRTLLAYDHDVYDEHSYKRQVVRNLFSLIEDTYRTCTMPVLSSTYSDLDDEIVQLIEQVDLPLEPRAFFYEYFASPSVIATLYPANFINITMVNQSSTMRQMLISNLLNNALIFIPLCYTPHYRLHNKDNMYINVLCYVSLVGLKGNINFPEVHERFIVLTIEMTTLTDLELHYNEVRATIINKIQIDDNIEEIIRGLQSCEEAFGILIENYNALL
jgi:hypothetical protein